MNHGIAAGVIPPAGLDKEEPELANEDDIPGDDRPQATDESDDDPQRPPDVERE